MSKNIRAWDDREGFMGKEVDIVDLMVDDDIKDFTIMFGCKDDDDEPVNKKGSIQTNHRCK